MIIYRFSDDEKVYSTLKRSKVKGIAWAHNYIMSDAAKRAVLCEELKAIVFVSHQMYDRYIDHEIIKKSTYIYNIVEVQDRTQEVGERKPIVTYTGALVPIKGFHIIARNWKKILSKVPEAQLYVIGSGKLYDGSAKVGSLGIASEEYENSFVSFLKNENGEILSSVHFVGNLGQEKAYIYKQSRVGIINPSARTETFGLGAVEMQSYGTPVVIKYANGLPDVAVHKKTALYFHTEAGMVRNIVKLLKNEELSARLGREGIEFVNKKFTAEETAGKWKQTIEMVLQNNKFEYLKPDGCYTNNIKWMRIFNRFLKENLSLKFLPAILDYECLAKNMLRKFKE